MWVASVDATHAASSPANTHMQRVNGALLPRAIEAASCRRESGAASEAPPQLSWLNSDCRETGTRETSRSAGAVWLVRTTTESGAGGGWCLIT